jgi:hypothetical protein
VHLLKERLDAFAECRIVVSPRALCCVARLDRKAAGLGRRGERRVRKVGHKRMHEGLMVLAIGGPSGSLAGMMSFLESVDIGLRHANESAERLAFRDHPLPDPSVTGRGGSLLLCRFARYRLNHRSIHIDSAESLGGLGGSLPVREPHLSTCKMNEAVAK